MFMLRKCIFFWTFRWSSVCCFLHSQHSHWMTEKHHTVTILCRAAVTFILAHPFMVAGVGNSCWKSALLSSQINMKLFHLPFSYLVLNSTILSWVCLMHCIKRLLVNALLEEAVQRSTSKHKCSFVQTLQASIKSELLTFFSSHILEYLEPVYLLKIHHKKKQSEKSEVTIP